MTDWFLAKWKSRPGGGGSVEIAGAPRKGKSGSVCVPPPPAPALLSAARRESSEHLRRALQGAAQQEEKLQVPPPPFSSPVVSFPFPPLAGFPSPNQRIRLSRGSGFDAGSGFFFSWVAAAPVAIGWVRPPPLAKGSKWTLRAHPGPKRVEFSFRHFLSFFF